LNLLRKEACCTAEGIVRSSRRAIRIWIRRTCAFAGTAATGQGGRELGAGPDSPTADLEGDALMSGVDRQRNREN